MIRNILLLAVFINLTHLLFSQKKKAQQPSTFRAAFVKVNISPETPKQLLGYNARLSTGVHDSIYHRIALLDDGRTQFVLVSTEICMISPAEYDRVATEVSKRLKIPSVNFWWSFTHTHSAPEVGPPGFGEVFLGDRYKHPVDTSYSNFVMNRLIDGINEARKNLQPAKLAKGWGYAQANINRRGIDTNGKASLGLNPDGSVDRRIGLIRIEKADGSLMGLISNYAIHGTVLSGQFTQVSGDVQGIVSQYVEEKTGVPMLFVNGAAGNLAPIYSVYPSPEAGHLGEFRVLLGDKIIAANKNIVDYTDTVTLKSGTLIVDIPAKEGLTFTTELKKYSAAANGKTLVRLPVRFLRIGNDLAIWAAPIELFCDISNEIREQSPFPYTFYYGYTNGWFGYMPTEDAWKNGGYEVQVVNPFAPEAEYRLKEAVNGFLDGEMK